MVELAEANIKVILCSVLPANYFYWQPKAQPATTILALKVFSATPKKRTVYIDYFFTSRQSERIAPNLL
jgi:hypothetical protein